MTKKEIILDRIKELSEKCNNFQYNMIAELYFGTLTLLNTLYGPNNDFSKSLEPAKNKYDTFNHSESTVDLLLELLHGLLVNMESDIRLGLIENIQKEVVGEIFGDFIVLAKNVKDDQYIVASVLASAALEDSLKKYAQMNGINTNDRDMTQVINALKSKSLIAGSQASIVSSYVQLRNKSFHADWNKISKSDVESLIVFTENFILEKFN